MTTVIENLKMPIPVFLEDCVSSFVDVQNKTFKFVFKNKDLSYENQQLKIKNLEVAFLLSENFLDEVFVPPVRILKFNKRYNRSIVRHGTLKEFVLLIRKKNYGLKFCATYYNESKCLLILKPIQDGILQDRIEYHIELSCEKIVYSVD